MEFSQALMKSKVKSPDEMSMTQIDILLSVTIFIFRRHEYAIEEYHLR